LAVYSTRLIHELETACRLARDAGAVLLEHFGRHGTVDRKDRGEPVTEADRRANDLIVSGIRRAFPRDWVLSEEAPDEPGRLAASRVWMIDPMDGTEDFIQGETGFSVMIGLCVEARPVLGVVYRPATGTLYAATKGDGATLDGYPIRVSGGGIEQVRLVTSRSHRSSVLERVREALGTTDEIHMGSVGLKVGLVACGARDLYVNPSGRSKLWDACAPQAILEAAGGTMTDVDGRPLDYATAELRNLRGLVASNGVIHQPVLSRVQPLLAATPPARAD
jgi:3'(2'),5'-bisphosphate nucleotidase